MLEYILKAGDRVSTRGNSPVINADVLEWSRTNKNFYLDKIL